MLNRYRTANESPTIALLGNQIAQLEANSREGILEVHLPKSEPYRVRKIEVTGT